MQIGNIKITRQGITWGRKEMGLAMTYAVNQNSILYMIGDNPRNYIKDGYLANPNVYSLMTLMVGAFIKGETELYDITDKDKPVQVTDHALLDLLHRPNPLCTRKEFLEACYVSRKITGEVFILKNKVPIGKDTGKVMQLIVLPAQYMEIKQDSTGMPTIYRYNTGGSNIEYPAEDIIYIKSFNPNGGIRGVSPLCAGREILAHDNDIITANRKQTVNMGPAGIMTIGVPGESDYTQEQLDTFKAKFRQTYQSANNSGDIYVTGEKVEWTATGLKADDIGLFEASKLTMRELCNIYGVSSQLLNDPDNKTYNNMLDARKSLISNIIIPDWHWFHAALNLSLIPEYEKLDGRKYEFRLKKQCFEELREEHLQLVASLNAAWWLTINQKLKYMGEPAITVPEGDDMYVPINALPVSTNTDAKGQLRNAYAGAAQGVNPQPQEQNGNK